MSATTVAQPVRSAQAHASSYTARRRKIATLVVALAFVMDLMDSTILTIALPTIQRHMHASLRAVNWMAAAYTLADVVLAPSLRPEAFGRTAVEPQAMNRFVLAASGHIAGVVNPPGGGKYSHWINPDLPDDPEEWLKGATEMAGSWWPDWHRWATALAPDTVPAREPGAGKLPVLEDAPGSYVAVRA